MERKPETPVMQTEIQDSPLPMDQTAGPIYSGDLSQDLNSLNNKRGIRRFTGVAGLTGALAIAGSVGVNAQESENPDTAGLIDTENPCPPGFHIESPLLSGDTDQVLSDGTVVTFPEDQTQPQTDETTAIEDTAPLSGELQEEITEPAIDAQNPDQPLDPEAETDNATKLETVEIVDPETGEIIICTPGELSQEEVMPTAQEALSMIVNQKTDEINNVNINDVKEGMKKLWNKHSSEMSSWVISNWPNDKKNGTNLDKKTFLEYIGYLEKGGPWVAKNKPLERRDADRMFMTSRLVFHLIDIYRQTEDKNYQKSLLSTADKVFDYGVTQIDPQDQKSMKKILASNIESAYDAWALGR